MANSKKIDDLERRMIDRLIEQQKKKLEELESMETLREYGERKRLEEKVFGKKK